MASGGGVGWARNPIRLSNIFFLISLRSPHSPNCLCLLYMKLHRSFQNQIRQLYLGSDRSKCLDSYPTQNSKIGHPDSHPNSEYCFINKTTTMLSKFPLLFAIQQKLKFKYTKRSAYLVILITMIRYHVSVILQIT